MPDRTISIYEPNRPGWPYIVVVRRLGEYEMIAVKTRKEARELAVAKRHEAKQQPADAAKWRKELEAHKKTAEKPTTPKVK